MATAGASGGGCATGASGTTAGSGMTGAAGGIAATAATGSAGWVAPLAASVSGAASTEPSLSNASGGTIESGGAGSSRAIGGTRTSVGATVLITKRKSYIMGTAARLRRASRSATGVIDTGAACAAITGSPSWMSFSDAASRRPANTTKNPQRNVAAIRRKLGSMGATSISPVSAGKSLHN